MLMESFGIPTPVGQLLVAYSGNKVIEVNLGLDSKKKPQLGNKISKRKSHFVLKAKKQMDDYFAGSLLHFTLDLLADGTDYQKSVWEIISSIKYGETLTYGDIAEQLNSSARAVGNACRANPIPIIVPCHRVVSKSGLGGFAGQREGTNIKVKTWLLAHERCNGLSSIRTK